MIVQIYSIESAKEAKELTEAGVDYIGIVVSISVKYPGVHDLEQAKKVLLGITGESKSVVMPFTSHLNEICIIAKETKPDILHIAVEPDSFTPNDIFKLKALIPDIKIMRTIPVVNNNSIELAKQYDGIVDYLLLDSRSKKTKQIGITGETHDWNVSLNIVKAVNTPIILAGGLGIDNVAEAIRKVIPFGVDSKTKTDMLTGGNKDIEKVKKFVMIAKNTLTSSGWI